MGRATDVATSTAAYARAASWYARSIEHAPTRLESYVQLAALLRGPLNDPARADRLMDARETKEGIVAANPNSARAYLARSRYRAEHQVDTEQVAADVARAFKLDPEDVDVILDFAATATDRGKARQTLRDGLKLHPDEERLYLALAQLETADGRPEEAIKILSEAIRSQPENVGLRWSLVEQCLEAGDSRPAQEQIRRLRKQPDILQEAVDLLEARALTLEGSRLQAVALLEHARPLLAQSPDQAGLVIQADFLLAQLYGQLGNPDRQIAAARRVLSANPRATAARLLLARALTQLGRDREAIEAYRRTGLDVVEARVAALRLQIRQAQSLPEDRRPWEEIDRELEDIEKTAPTIIEAKLLHAEALAARGQFERAEALVREVKDRNPDRVEPWLALASLAFARSGNQAMRVALDEAETHLRDRPEIRQARAAYWLRQGGEEAVPALNSLAEGLDRFPAESRRPVEDIVIAALRGVGGLDAARRLADRAAEQRPKDPEAQSRRFDLALLAGDLDGAARIIEPLRQAEGADGALWRFSEAALLLERARRGEPADLAKARSRLDEAAQRRPLWSRIPLAQAHLDDLQGREEQAAEHYLVAIERGEHGPESIRRAVHILNSRGRYNEAVHLISNLLEQNLPSGSLGQIAAEMSLHDHDPARALELARRAVPPDSADYRDHVWLGQVFLAAGQSAEAETELRRAVALAGDRPEPWVALVQSLVATHRPDVAEATIEEARRALPPDRAPEALAPCYELIGHWDEAQEQYQALLAARPHDSAVVAIVAGAYLRSGQTEKARTLLAQILNPKLRPSQRELIWARRRLATILAENATLVQLREAQSLVNENLRADSSSIEDLRLKALLLAYQPGGRREAIRTFEELARLSPAEPIERFLLAHLHTLGHEWDQAVLSCGMP